MMCQESQKNLMNFLTGYLSEEQKKAFEAHVSQCSSCAREAQNFQFVWNAMDAWEEQAVPEKIKEKILSTAGQSVVAARENVWATSLASLKTLLKPMAPVAMGLVAAVSSAAILSSKVNLSAIHPLGLTAVGALWTGLYAILFYFVFAFSRREASSWRAFAQASLVAVGIFLGLTLISPVPSSVQFCRYYSVTQPVIERLSVGGAFFLIGALYALIPMGIAAFLSGSRTGQHPLARGSMAGVMFVLLLAPSIYLQCAPFALGVLLVWFGGALVGSVLGGVLGYWVRYRFAGS
jgi:hypothetical protein